MTENPFNKVEEMDYLVNFVRDNLQFSDVEIRAAIEKIAKEHIPLERVDIDLSRELEGILVDYCDEYHTDISTIWGALTIEELIIKL